MLRILIVMSSLSHMLLVLRHGNDTDGLQAEIQALRGETIKLKEELGDLTIDLAWLEGCDSKVKSLTGLSNSAVLFLLFDRVKPHLSEGSQTKSISKIHDNITEAET